MVTPCLIGTDTEVRVRPFWTGETFPGDFQAQLNAWGDLTELILPPDGEALRISRYSYQGRVFTWIALYRHAHAFNSSRKNTFIGAGFFLPATEVVDGTASLKFLVDALEAFMRSYVDEGRQTAALLEIEPATIPPPESAAAMDRSIRPALEPGGLAPSETRLGAGVMFIDNRDVTPERAAHYLEMAQTGWQFEKYHTLIIGTTPVRMLKSKVRTVTPGELAKMRKPQPPRAAVSRPAPARGHRSAASLGGGPRLSSREQSAALGMPAPRDRYWIGVVSGIAASVLLGLIVWGLHLVQLRLSPVPEPDPTESSAVAPAAPESPAAVPPAASHDLDGALDATSAFFKSLCTADQAARAWSQATAAKAIRAFTKAHAPFCPLIVTVGTAQETAIEDKGEGKVLIAEVQLEATGGNAARPWRSPGRAVLRTMLDAQDRPGSWKVYAVDFASPPPSS